MRRHLIIAALLILVVAGPLAAQTSTGRHRPAAAAEAKPAVEAEAANEGDWYVVLGAGLASSGDLVRIRTANGGDQTWDPPEGGTFTSADFVLTLDENVAMGVGVGRRLGALLSLRLDFSAARLPVSALARVGESAEVYRWDDLSVASLALAGELRLSRTPSHFYLLVGGAATWASGNRDDSLDQTVAGLRFGGGYLQRLGGDWSLRGEIRDTLVSLDFDALEAPVPPGAPIPGIEKEDLGPQHVVELLLLLHGAF